MQIEKEMEISAGHIVQTTDSKCSRLHGHNWRIYVELEGPPADDGMIADFYDVKAIVNELDHKIMLPTGLAVYTEDMKGIAFTVHEKSYVLPVEDVVLLDLSIPVITCEHLAKYLAHKLWNTLKNDELIRVFVRIWETSTGSASYELLINDI